VQPQLTTGRPLYRLMTRRPNYRPTYIVIWRNHPCITSAHDTVTTDFAHKVVIQNDVSSNLLCYVSGYSGLR